MASDEYIRDTASPAPNVLCVHPLYATLCKVSVKPHVSAWLSRRSKNNGKVVIEMIANVLNSLQAA